MLSEYFVPILSCAYEKYSEECEYFRQEKQRIEGKGCDCKVIVGIDLSYWKRKTVFLCRKPDDNDRNVAKYWGMTVEEVYTPFRRILKTCEEI